MFKFNATMALNAHANVKCEQAFTSWQNTVYANSMSQLKALIN